MKRIFLLLILLLLSHDVFTQEKVVKLVTLGGFPPFCIKTDEAAESTQIIPAGSDAKGFEGLTWDIVRESYHAMGYTIHLSIYPWERAKHVLEIGLCDVLFPTGKNSEREKIYYYSKEHIISSDFLMYVRSDDNFKWEGLESLKGKTIASIRGFNYGDEWNKIDTVNKYYVNSIEQGFLMLKAKRVDGFLGYENTWDYILKENRLTSEFKKMPRFDSSYEFLVSYIANKSSRYIDDFDKGIMIIKDNGKFYRIFKKWGIKYE